MLREFVAACEDDCEAVGVLFELGTPTQPWPPQVWHGLSLSGISS